MQLKTSEFRCLFNDGLNGLAGELRPDTCHVRSLELCQPKVGSVLEMRRHPGKNADGVISVIFSDLINVFFQRATEDIKPPLRLSSTPHDCDRLVEGPFNTPSHAVGLDDIH